MLTRTTITIRECELPMPESREDLKTSLREQVADFLATEDPDAAGNADGDNPHINVTFASDVKNDDKPPLLTATITIRNYELLESCTNDFKDSLREHVANWFRVNVPAADGFAGDQDPDIIITLHTVDDDNRQQLPPTGIAIAPPGRSRAARKCCCECTESKAQGQCARRHRHTRKQRGSASGSRPRVWRKQRTPEVRACSRPRAPVPPGRSSATGKPNWTAFRLSCGRRITTRSR